MSLAHFASAQSSATLKRWLGLRPEMSHSSVCGSPPCEPARHCKKFQFLADGDQQVSSVERGSRSTGVYRYHLPGTSIPPFVRFMLCNVSLGLLQRFALCEGLDARPQSPAVAPPSSHGHVNVSIPYMYRVSTQRTDHQPDRQGPRVCFAFVFSSARLPMQ